MRWITSPPIISVPLVALLLALGSGPTEGLPLPLWGLFLVAYGAATAFHSMNLSTRRGGLAFFTNLTAQGLVLAFVSPAVGVTPIVSWLGLALASSGMVGLVSLGISKGPSGQRQPISPEQISISDIQQELKSLETELDIPSMIPLPALWGQGGVILKANREAKLLLGTNDLEGKELDKMINPSLHELELGGTGWLVFRRSLEGEDLVLLSPKGEGSGGDDSDFVDPKTGLYSDRYARRRGEEEIERARRYRRWLSMALLKLELESLSQGPIPRSFQEEAYDRLIATVKKTIRTSDLAFHLKDDCVLLLLPETPSSGARTLFDRIKAQLNKLFEEGEAAPYRPRLMGGFSFYGGNGTTSYGQMLEEAYSNMALNEG
ncbi:diguanylate cyclase domain-containing protein [Thermanaerovibrio acidaminovorans]|uniref:diguanylate cyclase domain-containing protein n=1 Tax=Thermanaerovibrio acidaminovorans TaxID=81462 RepID=UPI002492443F|nr:diguanylate cyclase [Thermanaerovibrio acidaminovorans]